MILFHNHVVEDIGNVFVFLYFLQEFLHFLLLFGSQFLQVVGNSLELEFLDIETVVFQIFLDGSEGLEFGENQDVVLIFENFFHTVIDELELEVFQVDTLFFGHREAAFSVEEEVEHAGGAQCASQFVEIA